MVGSSLALTSLLGYLETKLIFKPRFLIEIPHHWRIRCRKVSVNSCTSRVMRNTDSITLYIVFAGHAYYISSLKTNASVYIELFYSGLPDSSLFASSFNSQGRFNQYYWCGIWQPDFAYCRQIDKVANMGHCWSGKATIALAFINNYLDVLTFMARDARNDFGRKKPLMTFCSKFRSAEGLFILFIFIGRSLEVTIEEQLELYLYMI
jgi:hypothetical protein